MKKYRIGDGTAAIFNYTCHYHGHNGIYETIGMQSRSGIYDKDTDDIFIIQQMSMLKTDCCLIKLWDAMSKKMRKAIL